VDEITLFEEIQPPPPPDAPLMREAARARLTAATSAQLVHPARRRRATLVSVAAAAAMVAGGTAYGLTATQGSSVRTQGGSVRPDGSPTTPIASAGLTAVQGCPGKYVTAGMLTQLSGTQLIIQPANDTDHVTVATNASTAITAPATGTVSDITDGSRVTVQGTWSGRSLAATRVAIQAGIPAPNAIGPGFLRHRGKVRTLQPPTGALTPTFASGTVVNAHDGSFTVVMGIPILRERRVQVTTSSSTTVLTDASTSLSQLTVGANVVAVGTIGPHGVLTASTVTEIGQARILIPGGLAKTRSSGCSAAAITTAAILASG
jgi:hypothetical protein